jgi:hypothetical protein
MVFYTGGRRIEFEVTRNVVFFRLPLVGDVCRTRTFGWQFSPWHEVTAQLQAPQHRRPSRPEADATEERTLDSAQKGKGA